MEKVTEILIQANLFEGLWVETVCTVNNLKNRYPHIKLYAKVPLNVWRLARHNINFILYELFLGTKSDNK